MRQMACHPDLVLKSRNNVGRFTQDDGGEATVCRLCNDIAEDAIQSKCRHIFDRECIRQYLESTVEQNVRRNLLLSAFPTLTVFTKHSPYVLYVTSR